MESDIIYEHKQYLFNHYGIKCNSIMGTVPLMYWIPKMHKNPVGRRFTIASPQCYTKTSFKGYHCYI